jgi:hypothetical protein
VPESYGGSCQHASLSATGALLLERAGLPDAAARPASARGPRDARSVVADVLERDDSQESALEVRETELADAEHLGRLDVIWQGETRAARISRYQEAVRQALPEGYRTADLDGGHATWLWRTLRQAEEAGLDAAGVIGRAASERDLTGARDVAAVLDARIRARIGDPAPAPWQQWSKRVPETGDPVRDAFLSELAATMDDRKTRLGAHAAVTSPTWAVNALGPVPEGDAERARWQDRASHVAAYRELSGFDHETEPVGPEPVNSPEARSAWFAAYSAMTRADEAGLDRLPDGSLWHMRSTYAAETAWAPRYAGNELRLAHGALLSSSAQVARAQAEAVVARRAGDEVRAQRHERIAASSEANAQMLRQIVDADEKLMADRQEWTTRTAGPWLLAVQADATLRRRHPEMEIEPLKSAEPDPAPERLPELTTEAIAEHIAAAEERRAQFAAALEERLGMVVPSEDPDLEHEGEAWPAWTPAERDAILQPPRPMMTPRRDREPEPGQIDAEAV